MNNLCQRSGAARRLILAIRVSSAENHVFNYVFNHVFNDVSTFGQGLPGPAGGPNISAYAAAKSAGGGPRIRER